MPFAVSLVLAGCGNAHHGGSKGAAGSESAGPAAGLGAPASGSAAAPAAGPAAEHDKVASAAASSQASSASPASSAPDPNAPVGTVEGTIRLAPGAHLPSYAANAVGVLSGHPSSWPHECTLPTGGDLQPVTMDAHRGLVGVLVAATGDPKHFRVPHAAPRDIDVRIHDCRLTPAFVVATRGDTLVVHNEMKEPFMPSFPDDPFRRAAIQNTPLRMPLDRGGVRALACTLGVPCGRTDVIVLYHPVHAVIEAQGHYRLTNVPAGQRISLHAWHPLFKEALGTVTVQAGGTAHLDLVLSPLPPQHKPTASHPASPSTAHPARQ